jgi:hypothetical protein
VTGAADSAGLGDLAALRMLHRAAEQLGGQIHQQLGLRVGVIITESTTTIHSPTPRLIEAAACLVKSAMLYALTPRSSTPQATKGILEASICTRNP